MADDANDKGNDEAWLVYDGDCPFCATYARLARLRDSVGPLRLVNARQNDPLVDEVRAAGYDLDEGMVLKLGGRYYHGADCLTVIAGLSSRSTFFNRFSAAAFRSPTLSRLAYPVLRAGRNMTLRLLGRRPIAKSDSVESDYRV